MFLLNLIHFVQKKIFHISIHPMFLLNLCQIDRRNAYCHYFNTSHVSIKPFYPYFNTSHVSIKLIRIHPQKASYIHFNTSHVSIKRLFKIL